MTIDSREKDWQETAAELSLKGVPTVIGRLFSGDLRWEVEEVGTFGWELKSVSDLLSSLWSKEEGERLEWQLGMLREEVDFPVLGIHGLMVGRFDNVDIVSEPRVSGDGSYYVARVIKETGYSKASVDAFLWSVKFPSSGRGVEVVHRDTKEDLIRVIAAVYGWSRKETHLTFNKEVDRVNRNMSADLSALVALGVGATKGRALLKRFGCLGTVLFDTPDKDLLSVEGVGPNTVRKIRAIW